jgi:hypothetical protein
VFKRNGKEKYFTFSFLSSEINSVPNNLKALFMKDNMFNHSLSFNRSRNIIFYIIMNKNHELLVKSCFKTLDSIFKTTDICTLSSDTYTCSDKLDLVGVNRNFRYTPEIDGLNIELIGFQRQNISHSITNTTLIFKNLISEDIMIIPLSEEGASQFIEFIELAESSLYYLEEGEEDEDISGSFLRTREYLFGYINFITQKIQENFV